MIRNYFSKNRNFVYKILGIMPNFIYNNLFLDILEFGNNFKIINKHIKDNKINLVLDVGANLGHYSEGLINFSYKGKIIAFEPISPLYRDLIKKFKKNKNIQIYNLALGNEEKEMEINIASNFGGSSSIMKPKLVKTEFSSISFNKKQKIKVQKLDNIINNISKENDRIYMKLDVQGFEKEVILGSLKNINRIKLIQLETSTIELYEGEKTIDEIISYLYKQGFILIDIIGKLKNKQNHLVQTDLIFINRKNK